MKNILMKTIVLLAILIMVNSNAFAQILNLNDGLKAYYPFNGTVNDESPNSLNGEIYGDKKYKDGVLDQCIYLDGNGDYVFLGNGLNLNNDYSISLWIKSECNYRECASILSKYETSDYGPFSFNLYYGKLDLWLSDGTGDYENIYSDITVTERKWEHVSYVVSNNVLKIYLNSNLIKQSIVPAITQNDDKVMIGNQPLMFHPYRELQFKGCIDELKVYNRALTENEVKALFNTVKVQDVINDSIQTNLIAEKQGKIIADWLNNNTIALNTTNPESDTKDLMLLNNVLQNKQIIAMGEATHGTKEFYLMKFRIFKYLVEEFGFTVFAIEEPYFQCSKINEYILTGKGDLQIVIQGMYGGFYAQEIFDFINWMKDYNKNEINPEKKLTFFGFDSFNAQKGKVDIINYLNKVDIKTHDKYISVLNSLSGKSSAEIKSLQDIFQNNKNDYINYSSEKEWYHINHLITTILQYAKWINDEDLRELQMANNIDWYLNYIRPESKMFVWAHNSHISYEQEDNFKAMGTLLKKEYNDKYLNIGFEFDHGSFKVPNSNNKYVAIKLDEAPKGFLSEILRKADAPMYLINLGQKNNMPSEVFNVFFNDIQMHEYGGFVPRNKRHSFCNTVGNLYDCLIFIESTTSFTNLKDY